MFGTKTIFPFPLLIKVPPVTTNGEVVVNEVVLMSLLGSVSLSNALKDKLEVLYVERASLFATGGDGSAITVIVHELIEDLPQASSALTVTVQLSFKSGVVNVNRGFAIVVLLKVAVPQEVVHV